MIERQIGMAREFQELSLTESKNGRFKVFEGIKLLYCVPVAYRGTVYDQRMLTISSRCIEMPSISA
jgi:hypothetical protein